MFSCVFKVFIMSDLKTFCLELVNFTFNEVNSLSKKFRVFSFSNCDLTESFIKRNFVIKKHHFCKKILFHRKIP